MVGPKTNAGRGNGQPRACRGLVHIGERNADCGGHRASCWSRSGARAARSRPRGRPDRQRRRGRPPRRRAPPVANGRRTRNVTAPRTEPWTRPPGLASLDTLVARHAAAGLDVSVASEGPGAALLIASSSATSPKASAIRAPPVPCREALVRASCRIRYAAWSTALSSRRGSESAPGLERRTRADRHARARDLLGGSLEVERANGSFSVSARLPYGGQSP
jgi:hypothetical protein